MQRLLSHYDRLPVQLILSFVGLALLINLTVGLPALWLIRGQLERQAWTQVEQGRQATQALYAARQAEVHNLALLTAQRPTLRGLLASADRTALTDYLRTLQTGADLDALLVCSAAGSPVAQVGDPLPPDACQAPRDGWLAFSTDTDQTLWLLDTQPVEGLADAAPPQVIVGIRLSTAFAAQLRDQTGLEHTLLLAERPLVSTLPGDAAGWATIAPSFVASGVAASRTTFDWANRHFYAERLPLSAGANTGLVAEVALDVTALVTTQQRLVRTLLGGIVAVALIGSLLGAIVARRISRPLVRLADAAAALSQGTLDESLAADVRVREVAQVAQALETSGRELQHTLADLRQEKAWRDNLLEAIVEGIVTLDGRGRIVFFSPGAERISGWARSDVEGRACDDVFHLVEDRTPFTRAIPPPGQRITLNVRLANERTATLSVTGARLAPPESGAARVALVFRDISDEEAMHRLLGHFLANIAHEFRTPLAALTASIELLLDQAPDLSAAELQELLNSLHLGSLALQALVDNLLEGASIEAGRFRVYPHATDLSAIVAEATQWMQPLLEKRRQRLEVTPTVGPLIVRADAKRTVQALVNLLSNASKYSPDASTITISVQETGEHARISVRDQGAGIPADQVQDVFRRFQRSDNETEQAQYGVGLGLSLVKAIIEAQGGQVGVENQAAGGAAFWISIPIAGQT
ncbi:MAG: ATP-binding protein [Anaerolineae bacterium]